jgi:hypothetical protein
VLILSKASYDAFISLWNSLHRRLREKAVNSIRHTFKAEILSKMRGDELPPAVESVSTLQLDPYLLEAFLAEPEEEIDLGPLVAPHRCDRIRVENGIDNKSVMVPTDGLGGSNGDDTYSTTEDEQDRTTGDEDDSITEGEDYSGVEDSDVENMELSRSYFSARVLDRQRSSSFSATARWLYALLSSRLPVCSTQATVYRSPLIAAERGLTQSSCGQRYGLTLLFGPRTNAQLDTRHRYGLTTSPGHSL